MKVWEDLVEFFQFSKYRNIVIGLIGVAVCALVVIVAVSTLESRSNVPRNLAKSALISGHSEIKFFGADRFDEDIIIGTVLELEQREARLIPQKLAEKEEGNEVVEEKPLEPKVLPEVPDKEDTIEEVEAKPVEPKVNPEVPEKEETNEIVEEKPLEPVVSILGQGRIRGTTFRTRKHRSYYTFYNIPYARPPTGNNRFEIPRSPKRWYRTRDGTKPGPQCLQKDKHAKGNVTIGQEDCLYLNVHTSELPTGGADHPNLPVLFYIHGGGISGNGTRYKGTYLLDERVILVTLEFRMGALGGFTTGTSEYPGNMAQKDQVMALKWVQKNIERFGGDPKRVLIFGNSSGSGDVHAHMLSVMSSGLFSRAIMQSGSTIAKDRGIPNGKELLTRFLKEVGCDKYEKRSSRRLMDCLKNANGKDIVLSPSQGEFGGYAVEPLPPNNGEVSNVFLPDYPWNLLNAGVVNKDVPVIIGMNSLEMLNAEGILLNPSTIDLLNNNWDEYLSSTIGIPNDSNNTVAQLFRGMYFGDKPVGNETREGFVNLLSDQSVHPCRTTGMIQGEQAPGKVYFYWLTKPPPRSYSAGVKEIFPTPNGAGHADELQFLFEYDDYPVITTDSPWFDFSEKLVRMWVSFAATGRPISPTTEWLPIETDDNGMKWFELGDELKYVEPFTDRMLLWDEYTTQLYSV